VGYRQMLTRVSARLRSVFTRRRAQDELDDELAYHIEMETQRHISDGMAPEEARRRSLMDLGGVEHTRETVRDVHRVALDVVLQDLGYACRRIRREPGAALAIMLTLGLTVGLATAIYSAAESVLLRPFPYAEPERLLSISKADQGIDFIPPSIPDILDLRTRSRTVDGLGGFSRDGFVVFGSSGAQWVNVFTVTANLLDVVGLRAIRGRTFIPEDGVPGHEKVAVLGERLWRQAFGADPSIVGRLLPIVPEGSRTSEPERYRIVGVVGSDMEIFHPKHLRADMYVPFVMTDEARSEMTRGLPGLMTIARARPGVPMQLAQAELSALMAALAREHPNTPFPNATNRIVPLHEELVSRTRPPFLVLAAAAFLLLLIGCVNISGLLIASGVRRAHEFNTRLSLGCSRARLCQQLLTEHAVRAIVGGLLGVALALWATPLLRRLAPADLPRVADIHVHGSALAVAFGTTLLAWLMSGMAPYAALTRARHSVTPDLRGRTHTATRRGLRAWLVVVQVALVMVLLVSASMLAGSLWRVHHLDPGFQTRNVFVAQLIVSERWTDANTSLQFKRDLLSRLRQSPDVLRASIGTDLPAQWGTLGHVRPRGSDTSLNAFVAATDADYLPLLGIPLLEGRWLTSREDGTHEVVVINQALRRELGERGRLGERIQIDDSSREIVGIVGDIRELGQLGGGVIRMKGLTRLTLPAAYVPSGSYSDTDCYVLLRFRTHPLDPLGLLRTTAATIDPAVPVTGAAWLDDRVAEASAEARFCAVIVGFFAVAALILVAIGLYGILTDTVSERTVEIGIRAALGAGPRRIRWTIAGHTLALAVVGAAVGLGIARAGGRVLQAFLFEVTAADPVPLATATFVLAIVAAASAYLPVRRATRVDPARALRCDQ
jgi:predicted permease